MRFFKPLASIAIAALFVATPRPSSAQIYISLFAPPPMPVYVQPPVYQPNLIWTPGYWSWGPAGYYWVPGTWVAAPQPGLYWTPGYWGYNGNQYAWNNGYWGPTVGYYGGVNYGAGYYGNGYAGGNWYNGGFRYNTAVTNVNTTVIRNVYINKTVIVNNNNYTSYNGGRGGLTIRPTTTQVTYAQQKHIAPTALQREHVVLASEDRNLLSSVNKGKPPQAAVAKPFTPTNRPPNFKPVTAADKQNAPGAKPAPKTTPPPKPAAKATPKPAPKATPKPAAPKPVAPKPKPAVKATPKPAAPKPVQPKPAQAKPAQPKPSSRP